MNTTRFKEFAAADRRRWRASLRLVAAGLSVVLLLSGQVDSASAAHLQVFLLGGQSNMVGFANAGLPPAQPFADPLPEVKLYFGNVSTGLTPNTWIPLAPGAGTEFGPELAFGHTLHQLDPGNNYALIKYARNGSNVSLDWNPTVANNVYADFRTTVDAALQKLTDSGDTFEIAGMLWTQGIRDGKDGSGSSAYQTNLERLISDVRLNYRSDLPVFISRLSINMTSAGVPSAGGGRRDDLGGLARIRLGQENVVANDPLAFLIDTDEFGTDPTHFNTSGQVDLGKAFAESYFTNIVVPEPSTGVLAFTALAILGRKRRCFRATTPLA